MTVFCSLLILFSVFYFARIYIATASSLCSVALCFILLMLHGFIATSREKLFITNAFSQCLLKDIVDQLIAHQESFRLGGEKVLMSAIFTHIRIFILQ